LIALVKRSAIVSGPKHTVASDIAGEPLFAPVRFAVDDLVTAKGTVQLGDQIELHAWPMFADTHELRPVSRNSAALLLRNRPLDFGAKHCMRQELDRWNNMGEQARERAHVVLAVSYDVPLLFCAKWWPLEDAIAHFLFARNVDFVFEEIAQRPADTEKPFLAVSALDSAVVHVMSKFDICVERAGRLTPIARNMKAKFGGQHVAHDQRVIIKTVGRKPANLVLP